MAAAVCSTATAMNPRRPPGVGQVHGPSQLVQPGEGGGGVERRIGRRAEHRREEPGVEAPYDQIGVGDRGRPAAAIGRRARIGAGASRPHPGPQAIERQDRAAAGGHGGHVQHGRAQLDPGHLGGVSPLEDAGEAAHVGGRPAHVEPEDGLGAGRIGDPGRADDAAGRPGDHRVATPEGFAARQAAVGGHEVEVGAPATARERRSA